MGWPTHQTTEMPAMPIGRHRRRRISLTAIAIVLALAAVAVVGVIMSPDQGTPAGDTAIGGSAGPSGSRSGLGTQAAPGSSGAQTSGPASSHTTASPSGAGSHSAAPTPPKKAIKPVPPPATDLPSFETEVLALTNAARLSHGCHALRMDNRLRTAARDHTLDMARYGYMDHTGRDGSDPGRRIGATGYPLVGGWAENIARGYPDPEAVMQAWLDSPGHRANILNCGLKAIGVGAAKSATGEVYWTQDFGGV
jgi:uncharacterized protein YkwD